MEKSEMRHTLNLWVLLLRMNAGYLSALSLIVFGSMTAGHTGNVTKAFIALADGKVDLLYGPLLFLLCFFMGSFTSGYFFPHEDFKFRKGYGILYLLFALIYFSMAFIHFPPTLIASCLAFILGIQNGLFVFYRGVVVRTTILSGTITDLGVALGKHFRSQQFDVGWKLKFFSLNVLAFGFGAVTGATIFYFTDWNRALLAAGFNVFIGVYFLASHRKFGDVFQTNKKLRNDATSLYPE